MRGLAGRMRSAAAAFIDSLSSEQRAVATAPFEAPDREVWTYLPGDRPGLRIAEMGDSQRALALDLLATSYSPRGLSDAHAVRRIEAVRRSLPAPPTAGSTRTSSRTTGSASSVTQTPLARGPGK
jgi:hypothetical protein